MDGIDTLVHMFLHFLSSDEVGFRQLFSILHRWVGDIVELCTPCEVSGHERYAIVRSPVFLGDDSVKLGHSKDLGKAISRFLIPNAVE